MRRVQVWEFEELVLKQSAAAAQKGRLYRNYQWERRKDPYACLEIKAIKQSDGRGLILEAELLDRGSEGLLEEVNKWKSDQ